MEVAFPFFVGSERSGTTLIRVIFDTHSELAIPRESHFIVELAERRDRYEQAGDFDVEAFIADLRAHVRYQRWKVPDENLRAALTDPPPLDYPDAIRRLYACYARLRGKIRYGDKTPSYCLEMPLLAALFPEARFVHVIRDGRNVALSLLEVPWGPKTIEDAARFWRKRVLAARKAGAQLGPGRYLEYRHEDLIADPEREIRRICDFLDCSFEPDMLRYYEVRPPASKELLEHFPHAIHITEPPRKDLRSWRREMSPRNLRLFERLAGDILEQVGYARATDVEVSPQWRRSLPARAGRKLYRSLLGTLPPT